MKLKTAENQDSFTFVEHLSELRGRLISCFLSILIFSIIAYVFKDQLMQLLILPGKGIIRKFYFFSPHEAFLVKIKLAILCGFIVSLPVLFYQSWSFIRPGLFQHEKKKLALMTVFISFLFFLGVIFCYTIVLPICIRFLMSFEEPFFLPLLSFDKYINFMTMMLLSFGLVFLLPVFIYFLSIFNIVNAGQLAVHRGYVLIFILILAAVITPPDILTQMILAAPMYILFEVSVFVIRQMEKKRQRL